MVEEDVWGHTDPDAVPLEVPDEALPGRVFTQIGPWGLIPVWILSPEMYLPGVPDPAALKKGDERPLNGSELRVFIALKSYANAEGYARPFVSTLAERANVDKSSAERALAKFKRLGWLTSKRQYRDQGDEKWIRRCDYWVRDICPEPRRVTVESDPPANPRVPHPRNGGYSTRDVTGAMNTPLERTNRTDLSVEQISTTSDRSAPCGGGRTQSDDRSWAARDLNIARRNDLELFKTHVGEKVFSTGAKLSKGTFPAQQVYRALMAWKLKKKPIEWPGRLVETISNDGLGDGVDYFLATYGLQKVDA